MANQITPLSYANTFGDWVVTTNQVLAETNDIGANNYTKNTGTFIINSSGTGLQVANNTIIQGQLQVTGTGSSAVVQNDLTVSLGVIRAANTTFNASGSLGLRVDGAAYLSKKACRDTKPTGLLSVSMIAIAMQLGSALKTSNASCPVAVDRRWGEFGLSNSIIIFASHLFIGQQA